MPDLLDQIAPIFDAAPTVTVIGGMAKTGTTLPLTLLDGHPDLIVFPEEFRFFHMKADRRDAAKAARKFLDNGNTRMLERGKQDFGTQDYTAHGGTGFGAVDYSMFDWPLFEALIRQGFARHSGAYARLLVVIAAFRLGMGQPVPEGRFHFVCKAPHNERFARKWARMLGPRGRFIQCTRDPMEHYLSLSNISEMYEFSRLPPEDFAHTVRQRLRLWRHYPRDRLYVLDYDRLIADPEAVMHEIAGFIGIPFDPILLRPTKNGLPWAGNSSRGVVSETVFANPRIARGKLPPEVQRVIERRLHRFMARMGWQVSVPVGTGEAARDLLRRPGEAWRRATRKKAD